jgi:carbon starvation protein CstA
VLVVMVVLVVVVVVILRATHPEVVESDLMTAKVVTLMIPKAGTRVQTPGEVGVVVLMMGVMVQSLATAAPASSSSDTKSERPR